jgi:hypothetical protein
MNPNEEIKIQKLTPECIKDMLEFEMIDISKEAMMAKSPHLNTEELNKEISVMKKFMNPYIVFPVTLAMYSFFGLLYSLLIGAILKNKKS